MENFNDLLPLKRMGNCLIGDLKKHFFGYLYREPYEKIQPVKWII